jgi:hypothetical protein
MQVEGISVLLWQTNSTEPFRKLLPVSQRNFAVDRLITCHKVGCEGFTKKNKATTFLVYAYTIFFLILGSVMICWNATVRGTQHAKSSSSNYSRLLIFFPRSATMLAEAVAASTCKLQWSIQLRWHIFVMSGKTKKAGIAAG